MDSAVYIDDQRAGLGKIDRAVSPGAESILGIPYAVLDDGFVRLVDYMGNDESIVRAARISYSSTNKIQDDRTLLRHLLRERHTSPFEKVVLKFHIRIPMDACRQLVTHRTASRNEYSTRYSKAINSAQTTKVDAWRKQAVDNKQGSSGFLDQAQGEILSAHERTLQDFAREVYERRIALGVAKEQARKDLPLSTYTELIWKCDLWNTLHFLGLRMDPHAQEEIRAYATTMATAVIQQGWPDTYKAFQDYMLNTVRLTRPEIKILRSINCAGTERVSLEGLSKREVKEFQEKLTMLGFQIDLSTYQ